MSDPKRAALFFYSIIPVTRSAARPLADAPSQIAAAPFAAMTDDAY